MRALFFFGAAFAVIAIAIIHFTDGAPEKSCKLLMGDIAKRQLSGIANCTKNMKFKNGKDKSAKMTCILKCVMMNEGILTMEGFMTKEQFEIFLEKEIPDSMHEIARNGMGKCQEQHSAILDPKEEFCKTYDPLVKCFMQAVMQFCPTS